MSDETVMRSRRRPDEDGQRANVSGIDVAQYVAEIVGGLRELTRTRSGRDVQFLDQLLAMAEQEAVKLANQSYH